MGILGSILGGAISAGGSLIGGLLGSEAQEDANNSNYYMQKEFAKNGIRWKVEDAKAAGIHPLAALGAQVSSPSASYVGDTSLATGVAGAGQDISRAIHSTRSQPERISSHVKSMQDLQVEGAKLENQGKALNNQMLASQIAKVNHAPNPPLPSGRPLNGGLSGQQPDVVYNPLERVKSQSGNIAKEVGEVPDYQLVRTRTGGLSILPSIDAKNRMEDQLIPEFGWAIRNQLLPFLNVKMPYVDPRQHPLPKGYSRWKWNANRMEYQPSR